MKYHIAFKFLAILLCACSLLAALCSAVLIFNLAEEDFYRDTLEEYLQNRTAWDCNNAAAVIASRYASRTLGGCPEELLDAYFPEGRYYLTTVSQAPWYYTLSQNGRVLESTYENQSGFQTREYHMNCRYIAVVDQDTIAPMADQTEPTVKAPSYDRDAEATETMEAVEHVQMWQMTEPMESEPIYYDNFSYYSAARGFYVNCELAYYNSPEYTIKLYVMEDSFIPSYWGLIRLAYENRFNAIIVLVGSLLLFAAGMVYLCCAAGRKPGSSEVRPAAFNCLPLDLYAVGGSLACVPLVVATHDFGYNLLEDLLTVTGSNVLVNWGLVVLLSLPLIGIGLVVTAFLFAVAAQIKAGNGYWWRRSVTGFTCLHGWKLLKWLWQKAAALTKWFFTNLPRFLEAVWERMKKLAMAVWRLVRGLGNWVYRGIGWMFAAIGKAIKRFYALLPLTWQWLLTAFVLLLLMLLILTSRSTGQILLGGGICVALVLYGANSFGTLLESTKRMSQGDLDTKVDNRFLIGGFAEFAEDLNALADVAVVAAQKQMKSERMKAELVTNVSHDIKTPLTSIINYVDLLQKAQTPEEAAQYLEVLDRQAQRMKKLIDDLMEMSKATTGNLNVDIRKMDAVEAVNQALGEFSDKLTAAQLTPIFVPPEDPVWIKADGRLAWRVLSNLLSNAVKYALPGTRLYIDLVELEGRVLISLKNISRDQLNVSSEELMERFVRGDASRNTEGSGLGLNIAKSLMELQHGQLQLLVDGDLFKATLCFQKIESN